MTDREPPELDELKLLWQAQPEPPRLDIDAVIRKASRFVWVLHVRNALELGAAALVAVVFTGFAASTRFPWLTRLASAWTVAAAIFVAVWIGRYGRAKALPDPAQSTSAYVRAHREQLLGQARLLRRAPLWYFLPLGIGVFGFLAGVALEKPEAALAHWHTPAAIALFFAVLIAANLIAARNLRKEAARLGDEEERGRDESS